MNETEEKTQNQTQEREETIEKSSADVFPSGLAAPLWAVVSFEKCEAGKLSYAEAESKLDELMRRKISGLCIITDEAAERMGKTESGKRKTEN